MANCQNPNHMGLNRQTAARNPHMQRAGSGSPRSASMPCTSCPSSMPRTSERARSSFGCPGQPCAPVDSMPLAMAYVPWQQWQNIYEICQGFQRGTIFEDLDKPFHGRGGCNR